jgi:hypothetical protein
METYCVFFAVRTEILNIIQTSFFFRGLNTKYFTEAGKVQSVKKLAMDWTGVRFPAGAGNFLFATVSRRAVWSTQPPIRCVPGEGGGKLPGRECNDTSM